GGGFIAGWSAARRIEPAANVIAAPSSRCFLMDSLLFWGEHISRFPRSGTRAANPKLPRTLRVGSRYGLGRDGTRRVDRPVSGAKRPVFRGNRHCAHLPDVRRPPGGLGMETAALRRGVRNGDFAVVPAARPDDRRTDPLPDPRAAKGGQSGGLPRR